MIGLALILAMQAAPQPQPQPKIENTPAPWPDHERELGMVDAYTTDSDSMARRTMSAFAACVVEGSTDKASALLLSDFRANSYRAGIQTMIRNNDHCGRKVGLQGRLKMANLSFAGALAEALMKQRGAPLNAQLARAAASPAAPTYSFTDSVAMCVARSAPDQVAALFATTPGSAEETTAINVLATPAALCAQAAKARKPLSISPAGLRAMLATASFRSVASMKEV
ncbi:hypothetical protein [Parafrankia sp. BMG5.11]|uniref:hypothetical protein n=1 Tax=Parafrankia sp. BMG5.11 TaxID=222540 RepID=UPI00103F85E7|nr:hypothetical protein [Parafrankia sp. BMG5.11]TCJ37468.1 hypothetical protein E0504_20815 [Parafrankia sp. BMG5.11]